MHSRRLTCFVLGIWLAGGLFMAWVATQNFRSVDRLLAQHSPTAALDFKTLGHDQARLLLRYQVSEQNRWYFESWEIAQIILGALFFFYLLFGATTRKFSLGVVVLMLFIVLAQRFLLTPEIVSLGRIIDFTPPDPPSPERTRFWMLHGVYTSVEFVKWALALLLAGQLILGSRSGHSRQKVDVVDEADHRHVDR